MINGNVNAGRDSTKPIGVEAKKVFSSIFSIRLIGRDEYVRETTVKRTNLYRFYS